MRCTCRSAPQYHRDDCPDFDSYGNPKRSGPGSIYMISDSLPAYKINPKPNSNDAVSYFANDSIDSTLILILDELNHRERISRAKFPQKLQQMVIIIDNSKSIIHNHQSKINEIIKKSKRCNLTLIITT